MITSVRLNNFVPFSGQELIQLGHRKTLVHMLYGSIKADFWHALPLSNFWRTEWGTIFESCIQFSIIHSWFYITHSEGKQKGESGSSCYTHVWAHTAQKHYLKKPLSQSASIHLRPDTIHTCSKGEGAANPSQKTQKTKHTQRQR